MVLSTSPLCFLQKRGCQKPYWGQAILSSLVSKQAVTGQVSCVTCHISHVICQMVCGNKYIYLFYKVVEQVVWGSVINRAYHVSFVKLQLCPCGVLLPGNKNYVYTNVSSQARKYCFNSLIIPGWFGKFCPVFWDKTDKREKQRLSLITIHLGRSLHLLCQPLNILINVKVHNNIKCQV